MSRESTVNRPNEALANVSEELLYQPTSEDRRLKAAFLALIDGNPLIDSSNLPMKEVERILGRKLPNKEAPGFSAWFLNKDENRQKLEYLFSLAIGAAEDILLNTDPKAQGARVNMIKVVSELANKYPRQTTTPAQGQNLLGAIGSMDRASLKLFLQQGGKSVEIQANGESSPTIDAEVTDGPKQE